MRGFSELSTRADIPPARKAERDPSSVGVADTFSRKGRRE
jgi:hypothetical protein